MTTTTRRPCARRDRRFSVTLGEGVQVEFAFPQPHGERYTPALLDISVAGLSFALSESIPSLESGTKIEDADVVVGNCKMKGDLLVLHMRREDSRTVVGALFYPSTDEDLTKLMSVIAGIEAVHVG